MWLRKKSLWTSWCKPQIRVECSEPETHQANAEEYVFHLVVWHHPPNIWQCQNNNNNNNNQTRNNCVHTPTFNQSYYCVCPAVGGVLHPLSKTTVLQLRPTMMTVNLTTVKIRFHVQTLTAKKSAVFTACTIDGWSLWWSCVLFFTSWAPSFSPNLLT